MARQTVNRLTLRLFGGFEVQAGPDEVVTVPTRKAQALLAYLTLSREKVHSRANLAALLWPSLEASAARNALRQTLFVLRKALAPVPSALAVTDDEVAVDRDVVTDVAAFEQAVATATPASLEQAAELYRGDLLAGLSASAPAFEDWLMSERERLRELAIEALARLLAHRQATDAVGSAVLTALRLLTLDPTQEAAHRSLMRLHVRQGRRDAALHQYQECVDVLQRELGSDPEPETRRLYGEILRERSDKISTSDVASITEGAIIGRDADIARMHHALTRAWAGAGGLVAVLGEAGIGKSRLLAELGAEGKRRGGAILLGRAYENEQMAPLAPWLGALRDAGVPGDRVVRDELDDAERAVLARLLPEIGEPPQFAETGPGDQLHLFESLAHVLRSLSVAKPVVVLLEDCHWADDMTVRFLAFFTRRLHAARILIAVSVRDDELAEHTVLDATLAELAGEQRMWRIDLTRLGREDTLSLAERSASAARPAAVAARHAEQIWEASEGNPFIIVETMRALGEASAGDSRTALTLPGRVRDMISNRLGRLTATGQDVLAVASVIGREFEFDLLPVAARLGADAVADVLEELVRRRVLHAVADRLDFVHDRIREVAYDRLAPERRRLLHAAVASAIETRYADDRTRHYTALAFHFGAGEVWPKAVEYLREAGAQAMERGAYHESAASFERALAMLDHVDDEAPAARAALDLRLRLRNALLPIGDQARMLANLRAAERLAERVDDQSRLGWILSYSALEFWRVGESERALDLAARVLTIGRALDERGLRIIAGIRLGQAHHSLGRYAEAIHALRDTVVELGTDRAQEHFGLSAPPSVIARVWLGWCLAERGDFAEARRHAEDALTIAEEMNQPYPLVVARFGLGLVDVRQGEPARAIAVLESGLAVCRSRHIPVFLAWTASLLAMVSAAAGRTDGDASLFEAATERESAGSASRQAFPVLWLGEAHLMSGRLDQAATHARDALELATARHDRAHEAYALHLMAQIAAHRQKPEAESLYRQAWVIARELGMQPLLARCEAPLGRLGSA